MKYFKCIMFAVCFGLLWTGCSPTETFKNPNPVWEVKTAYSDELTALDFPSDAFGYAVSAKGGVLKSNDGGSNWTEVNAALTSVDSEYEETHYHGIGFPAETQGYIVGAHGKMLYTSNGGDSWASVTVDSNVHWYDITFVNSQRGFLAGSNSVIYKTTDGGANWSLVHVDSGGPAMHTIHFFHRILFFGVDTKYGLAAGESGRILRTTDGGNTWTTPATPVVTKIHAIKILDADHAFAVTDNRTVLYSDDAGKSWSEQVDVIKLGPSDAGFHAVAFADEDYGFVLGEGGMIAVTFDRGEQWRNESVADAGTFQAVYLLDRNTGYAVSEEALWELKGQRLYPVVD